MSKNKIFTVHDSAILRKFTSCYILTSLVPLGLLIVLYFQMSEHGRVDMPVAQLRDILLVIISTAGIGYFTMRLFLRRIIDVTNASRQAFEETIGLEKIREIIGANTEIAGLARNFQDVTQRLEENIRQLEHAKKTLHSALTKVGQCPARLNSFRSMVFAFPSRASQRRVCHPARLAQRLLR